MTDRTAVEELLRRRIGLDPASAGPGLVSRATRARMNALGMAETEVERYRALVSGSEQELQALVEEVVVPESWFFRDEHPFAMLVGRAASGWLAEPSREPLRVLSVPCAGGEEPYSVAISLLDAGLNAKRFRVDAVDVSRAVLGSASRGVYTANAFRSSDLSFRDRHFRPTASAYELSARVKETVEFLPGNLLDASLLADRPAYDVVFCRNLLIYLDGEARGRAIATLERLLSPSGLLFVGHAEHLGRLSPLFRPTGDRRCFAYEKKHDDRAAAGDKPPHPRREPGKPRGRGSHPKPAPPTAAPRPAKAAAPAPPGAGHAPSLLEQAAALADKGRHGEAAALCEREIGRSGPSAPALYLLGVVRQAAGDRELAERCFEKAVYLDPGHEDALLSLSLLAQRRGDLAAAAGYRRRAERAYGEKPKR